MNDPTAAQPVCTDCLPSATPSSTVPAERAPIHPSRATTDDPLDACTFRPPILAPGVDGEELPRIIIEFCDRCRWLHRATWTLTELFLTFPPTSTTDTEGVRTESGLKAITLLPRSAPETGGRFRVWLYRYRSIEQEFFQSEGKENWGGAELVWDRKIEGRFPEMKELKQRVRNLIAPTKDLGHSDKKAFAKTEAAGETETAPAEQVAPLGARDEGEDRAPRVDDYAPRFKC